MNPVVKILTVSDIIFMSGWGLLSPIFAVYITDSIQGGTLEVVGIASTIYLITKSFAQLFTAELIDRIKGEKDDYFAMILGSIAVSFIPLLYIFITTPWGLYVVQFVYGLAVALTFPSWMAIFTRHIDKSREGIEWGIYFTSIDIFGALAAALGGFVAERFGFTNLFIVVSIFSFIGSFYLVFLRRYLDIRRKST